LETWKGSDVLVVNDEIPTGNQISIITDDLQWKGFDYLIPYKL